MYVSKRPASAQQLCLWSVGAAFAAVSASSLLAFLAPAVADKLPVAFRFPMSFNTMVCMLWLALGFFAATLERRALALCCIVVPVLLGCLSLLQNLAYPSLGVDEILWLAAGFRYGPPAGHVSTLSALAMILSATALVVQVGVFGHASHRPMILGIVGSTLGSLALTS